MAAAAGAEDDAAHHHCGAQDGAHGALSWSTSLTLLSPRASFGPDLASFACALAVAFAAGLARQELLRWMDDDARDQRARTAAFFAQTLLAYALMLVAMDNGWGLLAVAAGLTAGYHRNATLKPAKAKPGAAAAECCS